MAAALLGGVPGVSQVFCGSAVTYREATKTCWLDVPEATLQRYTAESPEATRALADQVLRHTPEATVAAAVTGHLGPDADDDIDGLVHISQLSEDHVAKVKDVIKVGDDVEARVIKVDKVERRIGLSIKAAEYNEEQLKKETQAFDALRPSSDLVGLEQAFNLASEEWRPGGEEEAAEDED